MLRLGKIIGYVGRLTKRFVLDPLFSLGMMVFVLGDTGLLLFVIILLDIINSLINE